MKLDPGMHIGMHLVLLRKIGCDRILSSSVAEEQRREGHRSGEERVEMVD
jgi:hypothetical protein